MIQSNVDGLGHSVWVAMYQALWLQAMSNVFFLCRINGQQAGKMEIQKKHHHKDYMLRMILINKINDQLWLKRTHPLTVSNLKILLSNHKATKNLHKEFQEQYKTFATSFACFSKIRALSCFTFNIRNCPSKMYKTE